MADELIRPYQREDRVALIEVFKLNTPKYFDPKEVKDFKSYLEEHSATYLIVELNGQVVGGSGYYVNAELKTGHISWIFFHPEQSGNGLGTKVVEQCHKYIREHKQVEKYVVATSQLAFKFFQKFGYHTIRTEKDYWGEGLDLYAMERQGNC